MTNLIGSLPVDLQNYILTFGQLRLYPALISAVKVIKNPSLLQESTGLGLSFENGLHRQSDSQLHLVLRGAWGV